MNQNHLIHHLDFLTGPLTAGRLSGTEGALRTAKYLLAELNTLGFESTLQPFDVPAMRLTAPPRLVIANRMLSYRRDFAEMTMISTGGQVKGQLLVVRDEDLLPQESFNGRVVLIPERPKDFNFAETAAAAADLGVVALLAEHGEPQWFHKTVYPGNGKIPALRVRKSIAQELAQLDGAEVELNLPLQNGTLPCNNVLGFLRGASNDFTLALTAHYDHVGDDPENDARFPGALDNASGVATILEAARELVQEPLPFNLLVAFLTGEESGLWGAKHLIANPPVPISAAINLDCIGNEARPFTFQLGHKQPGDWLAGLAEDILLKRGIQTRWAGGRDDSAAFSAKKIPTVGLLQQYTQVHNILHTPLDTFESIHLETIQEGIEILLEIVDSISETQNKEKKHVHTN